MIYYSFTPTGQWSGNYESTSGTYTLNPVSGSMCEPGDILKIEHSTSWDATENILFDDLTTPLNISNLIESDWTQNLKDQWVESYLKFVGMGSYINTSEYTQLYQILDNDNIFYKLSYPSIAYVNQDLTSGEISIGVNVYDYNKLIQWATEQPDTNILKSVIHNNHYYNEDNTHYPVFISHAFKVVYQNHTEIMWTFDGLKYDEYDISNIADPTLLTGGGNIFGEIKMAGNGIKAHYIVKKDIDPKDPTQGLCSGVGGPFCMGDKIELIDTTIWTKNFGTNGTGSWTWIGDPSQLNYTWHIADVTNPCYDYRHHTIPDMLFPIRVIQECILDDFGYHILDIKHTSVITDIIVHIDENPNWLPSTIVTITDMSEVEQSGDYCGNWTIIMRGFDSDAIDGSTDSRYYRLRRNDFNNTLPLVKPTNGQIYYTNIQ